MFCPACGTPNVSEANFCANCGAVLAPGASYALRVTAPCNGGLRQTGTRISTCTATIVMIPAGAIVGTSLGLTVEYVRHSGSYFEVTGAFVAFVILFTGIAMAASIIPPRFITGRIAVFGVPLIVLGSWFGPHYSLSIGFAGAAGMVGFGIGVLLPLIFWRQILAKNQVASATLVVTGLVAGVLGFITSNIFGSDLAYYSSMIFSLLFVTPAILIKPVIQRT